MVAPHRVPVPDRFPERLLDDPAQEAELTDPATAAPPLIDLTALLSRFDAERLARLLSLRPDLADPPPRTLTDLAWRAGTLSSQTSCRAQLDEFTVQVLDAAIIGGDLPAVRQLLGDPPPDRVEAAVDRLAERGLLDANPGLRVPTETASWPRPARLGPPYATLSGKLTNADLTRMCRDADLVNPPTRKADLLEALAQRLAEPETVRRLLARGPEGTVELAERIAGDGPLLSATSSWSYNRRADTPVSWLEHCGLVVRHDWSTAVMPREVGVALRGGRLFAAVRPDPPPLTAHPVDAGRVDAGAGEAAMRVVRDVADLCAGWEETPAKALAGGGLGSRELRRAAKLLRRDGREPRDEADIALLAELAAAAGLIGVDAGSQSVQPLAAYDEWLARSGPDRWRWLLAAWWCWDRHLSLAGATGVNDKLIPAVWVRGPEPDAELRRRATLAMLPDIDGSVEIDELTDRLCWQQPALWRDGPAPAALLVRWMLREAALLGVVADEALASTGRALLAGDLEAATAGVAAFAPAATEELVLQADLTAIVPGELPPADRAELELMADPVSTGSATVYRFSDASLRRAMDAGRSAERLSAYLAGRASRGVPQPLEYMIRDLGRRHGRLRVGTAESYLHCDDPALVAEVVATRRLARLGLRTIAPSVLVSDQAPDTVVAALQDAGFLPAQEDSTGALVLRVRPRRRAQQSPSLSKLARRSSGTGQGFGPVAAQLQPLLASDGPANDELAAKEQSEIATLAASLLAGRGHSGQVTRLADRQSVGRSDALFALPPEPTDGSGWATGKAAGRGPTNMGDDGPAQELMRAFQELVDGLDADQADVDGFEFDPNEGPPRPPEVIRGRHAIAEVLISALDWAWLVELSYVSRTGVPSEATVLLENLEGDRIRALRLSPDGIVRTYRLSRVQSVRVLTEAEEEALDPG